MRLRASIIAALLLLPPLAGCATRPAAIQQPTVQAEAATPSIAGTTWAGTDVDDEPYVYRFLADGTVHYTTPNGSWTNGTWRQEGDEVYIEMNDRYAERVGTIVGSRMKGRGWNVAGHQWTWAAERQ